MGAKTKSGNQNFIKRFVPVKITRATESELETHLNKPPVPPQIRRTIFNETTIEGMLKYYSDSNRSLLLYPVKGVILTAGPWSKLGIINTLWDGGSLFHRQEIISRN